MSLPMNKVELNSLILIICLACSRETQQYIKAANGDPAAMRELGEKLRKMGDHSNANEGLRWLKLAAEKGDAQAMCDLGLLYDDSPLCTDSRALYWYKKGAEAGNLTCMMKLSNAYRYGQFGLEKDLIESKYWFDKIDAIKRKERGY